MLTTTTSSLNQPMELEIQNFSNLLHKLQIQNISIQDLRILKTQHNYLQKLRGQRQKIQDLKYKYTLSESARLNYEEQLKSQSKILQEQRVTIEILHQQLENQRESKIQLEANHLIKIEAENNKLKQRVNQMNREMEELRKIIKSKEFMLIQVEQENEERLKSIRDHFSHAKKQLVAQVQQRLQQEIEQKQQLQNQLSQLRSLIAKQNKTLKQQGEKYQELYQSNTKLLQELQSSHQQINNLTIACEQYYQKLNQTEALNQRLQNELDQKHQNLQSQGQLQDLRKRMQEMAKGEIQKIQFIVNDFD